MLHKQTYIHALFDEAPHAKFNIHEVTVQENINTSFEICFHGSVSLEDKPLPSSKLINTFVCLHMHWPNGQKRFFHGCIGALNYQGRTSEHAELHYTITAFPSFWFLQHDQRCRIFQNLSTIEIIEHLLTEYGIKFDNRSGSAGQKIRDFCVQYHESTQNFLTRLMEEVGLFFFFEHHETNHTLVICDDLSQFNTLDNQFQMCNVEVNDLSWHTHITKFTQNYRMTTSSVHMRGFNFLSPMQKIDAYAGDQNDPWKVYHATMPPIYNDDGELLAKVYMQSLRMHHDTQFGASHAVEFSPGYVAQITHMLFNEKRFAILSVHHCIKFNQLKNRFEYSNTFHTVSAQTPFRSPVITPKPRIFGAQTAIVTGSEGEEIWTEEYGRIKVRFHWDENLSNEEDSSCWIRVAQAMAGQGWGFLSTPRIGQEVIVNFINGNPDEPLIMGCVYNGSHPPPYVTADPSISTWKTHTLGGDDQQYNELRFTDKPDEEHVLLRAQKDAHFYTHEMHTWHVETGSIEVDIDRGDRRVTLHAQDEPVNGQGNDFLTLNAGNRTVEFKSKKGAVDDQLKIHEGNQKVHLVKGYHEMKIDAGDQKITLSEGNRYIELKKGNQSIKLSKGNRQSDIHGNDTLTIDGGNLTIKVKSGNITIETSGHLNCKADGNIQMSSKGNVEITASKSLTLKGNSGVTLKSGTSLQATASASVKIQGSIVKIN